MCKFLIFFALIAFSGISSAASKWIFFCPQLKVFCSEARHEVEIRNPELKQKYKALAFLEDHSWSSEINLEGNSSFKLKVSEGFCNNTYVYISFAEATNKECKYIINEL